MSNSGLPPAEPTGGRNSQIHNGRVVSMRRRVPTNWVSDRTQQPLTEPVVARLYVPSDFIVGRPS